MAQPSKNLIWIDLEMTGLDVVNDDIIEIATVVTDQQLNCIATGPVVAIQTAEEKLAAMNDWNQKQHGQSGLLQRVRESTLSMADAEHITLVFLRQYVEPGFSPMCGNSICQDRRFLHRQMPELERFFHYRNLDVSTLKCLAQYWYPNITFNKQSQHLALSDIEDSIEELKHYRQHCFVDPSKDT